MRVGTPPGDCGRGLAEWSTFKYYRGVQGHDAYNRDPGPELVLHPDDKDTCALRLARPHRPDLLRYHDGAVWNFPAGTAGEVRLRLCWERVETGIQICLLNRWFNPTDHVVQHFDNYVVSVPGDSGALGSRRLEADAWIDVTLRWEDATSGLCTGAVNGQPAEQAPQQNPSVTGISYLHLQALAKEPVAQGVLVDHVMARASSCPGLREAKTTGFE